MGYYSFWKDKEELKSKMEDFLFDNFKKNKESCEVKTKMGELGIYEKLQFAGWADNYEETLLFDEDHLGSLWTTGDILFILIEKVKKLQDEDLKKIKSALGFLKNLYSIRQEKCRYIPIEYYYKDEKTGDTSLHLPISNYLYIKKKNDIFYVTDQDKNECKINLELVINENEKVNIEKMLLYIYSRIATKGFPERIKVHRKDKSGNNKYEIDVGLDNNIFACSSILLAFSAAIKKNISFNDEEARDLTETGFVYNFALELANAFCIETFETTINIYDEKNWSEEFIKEYVQSDNSKTFPVKWSILPGRRDAKQDLYATAAVLMSLSYCYITLMEKNYNIEALKELKKKISDEVESFLENLELKLDSNKTFKFSDYTRVLNSLCFIYDFIIAVKKEDLKKKVEEKINKLASVLLDKINEILLKNGKLYDQGRISRELNGDVIQFAGVDVSFISLTLMLILKRRKPKETSNKISSANNNFIDIKPAIINTLISLIENQVISETDKNNLNLGNLTKENPGDKAREPDSENRKKLKKDNKKDNAGDNPKDEVGDKTEKIIGGYVWAGNETSNPYSYQDVYFWQTAYAYWAVSLFLERNKEEKDVKRLKQEKEKLKDINKVYESEIENYKFKLESQIFSFIISLFYILLWILIEINRYELFSFFKRHLLYLKIVIRILLSLSILFSSYYFYSDKLTDITPKNIKMIPIRKILQKKYKNKFRRLAVLIFLPFIVSFLFLGALIGAIESLFKSNFCI